MGKIGLAAALIVSIGAGIFVYTRTNYDSAYYPQGGMWLPQQMPQHEAILKKMGLQIPASDLSDPANETLAASVFLGGCSASFVSSDGLIITNHHCVVNTLNYLSKDGNDYQTNGFLASNQAAEKPAPPTQKAYITLSSEDVTDIVRSGLDQILYPALRAQTVEKRIADLIAQRESAEKKRDPSIYIEVKGFYRDSMFLLYRKKELKDIRMVYAPKEGIGNFGGDIDNWHWPRHSGDFALLRAYVSKKGEGIAYRPDNVPYRPVHYLRLASEPLKEGDLVFIMGYPGATERWETPQETQKEVEVEYPHMIERTRGFIEVVEAFEKDPDPQTARVAKGLLPRPRNYLPLWEGELAGMIHWNLVDEKKAEQAALFRWIDENGARRLRYSRVQEDSDLAINVPDPEGQKMRDRAFKDFLSWGHQSRPPAHLLRSAYVIWKMAEERAKPDGQREPEYRERNWEPLRISLGQVYQDQIDIRIEKAIERFFLLNARKVAHKDLLRAVTTSISPHELLIDAKLSELYEKTELLKLDRRLALFDRATVKDLTKSTDPAIQIAGRLIQLGKELKDREDKDKGKALINKALWAEARSHFMRKLQAPDANATQRVTFGTVRSYRPSFFRGRYPTFTYASEISKKATGKEPFDAPQPLLRQIASKSYGPYADATGDVPVAFVSDLDITGGNSGSPVLNRKGELAGVAFDGVWESLVNDKKYLPALSRTISVDIRYFLWVLDGVESAKWLLEEMHQNPHLASTSAQTAP